MLNILVFNIIYHLHFVIKPCYFKSQSNTWSNHPSSPHSLNSRTSQFFPKKISNCEIWFNLFFVRKLFFTSKKKSSRKTNRNKSETGRVFDMSSDWTELFTFWYSSHIFSRVYVNFCIYYDASETLFSSVLRINSKYNLNFQVIIAPIVCKFLSAN